MDYAESKPKSFWCFKHSKSKQIILYNSKFKIKNSGNQLVYVYYDYIYFNRIKAAPKHDISNKMSDGRAQW